MQLLKYIVDNFKQFFESTMDDLYVSMQQAFPRTTKREHSTQTIKIVDLKWTPFLGLNTLLIRGKAQNEGKEYKTTIVFKEVDYSGGPIKFMADDGKYYEINNLSEHDILVRCDCPDFKWRWKFENSRPAINALVGNKGKKYEGQGLWEANPLHLPGLCKHLLSLSKALNHINVL